MLSLCEHFFRSPNKCNLSFYHIGENPTSFIIILWKLPENKQNTDEARVMELSRPMKNVLSLGKFTHDIKAALKNKIPVLSSKQNSILGPNQNRRRSTDSTKSDKFSSRLQFYTPHITKGIQNLKNLNRRSEFTSLLGVAHHRDDSLSHMPVYHKVISFHSVMCLSNNKF